MMNDDNNEQQNGFVLYGNPYEPAKEPQVTTETDSGAEKTSFESESAGETTSSESYAAQDRTAQATAAKPEKKHIGRKIAVGLVSAITLGAVAGAACFGVSYLGYRIFPVSTSSDDSSTTNATSSTTATQISTGNINVSDVTVSATVMDVSEIVNSVIASVIEIDGTYTYTTTSSSYGFWGGNQTQTYESTVSGSGIIISQTDTELLIVTNYHVIEDIDDGTMTVTFYDGSVVTANVKGTDSSHDLAVIAIQLEDIPDDAIYTIATLGDSTEVEVGDAAIAIGNSMGYGISVTTGIISALGRSVTVDDVVYDNLIQTDAAINAGNSGGALFNAAGEVIGINSVKMNNTSSTNVEGMGYAISISYVQDIIDELSTETTKIKLSDDERGYLGISGVTITESISSYYGYPIGALVRSVSEGSAADEAGIVKNDIIVALDGNTIETYDDLYNLMFYYPIGATVEIQYYHLDASGEFVLMTTTVTLTERPDSE